MERAQRRRGAKVAMKREAQVLELLERAARLNLWLSHREIGFTLGLKKVYCRNIVGRLRRQGLEINSRSSNGEFEWILARREELARRPRKLREAANGTDV